MRDVMDLEKIQTKDFCCLNGFVESFVDKLFDFDDEFTTVSVIADGDIIQEIFRQLMSMTGTCEDFDDIEVPIFDMNMIDFCEFVYNKEYVLTIDYNMQICIERACDNKYCKGYIDTEANAVFIYETANWNVLNHVDADEVFIFGFEN